MRWDVEVMTYSVIASSSVRRQTKSRVKDPDAASIRGVADWKLRSSSSFRLSSSKRHWKHGGVVHSKVVMFRHGFEV